METKDKKEKLPPVKEVTPGIYMHYKGKKYAVHMTLRHSETLEELAFYECLYENENGQFWVRPVEHFFDYKEVDGKKVKRFELTEEFPAIGGFASGDKEESDCGECCEDCDDEKCHCGKFDKCMCEDHEYKGDHNRLDGKVK